MSHRTTASVLAALLAVGTAACTAPGDGAPESAPPPVDLSPPDAGASAEPVEPPAPVPWTERFQGKAMLLADHIRVEGPEGLLENLALRSDDALFERTVRTVPAGFEQVTRPRVGADGGREVVRGQLNAWLLAARLELVTLERPGDVPVTIVATGDAVWRDPDGGEQRGPRLEFAGVIAPPSEDAAPTEGAPR